MAADGKKNKKFQEHRYTVYTNAGPWWQWAMWGGTRYRPAKGLSRVMVDIGFCLCVAAGVWP
eukprot:3333491-Amphidinium_carterae.1